MEKILVIAGSARCESNTLKSVHALNFPDAEILDLLHFSISPYRYHETNRDDNFMQVVSKMLEADLIVFATPVYWYSMSWVMKVFFDRLTDLLMGENKVLGRKLKGKKTFLLVQGASEEIPVGFEVPFKSSSEYFEMEFTGHKYIVVKE